MVSLARRNLFHERTRLAISVLGVGFAILLISLLGATYAGFERATGLYIDHLGGDLVVLQEGARDLFHSFSILPQNLSVRLEGVDGVRSAEALLSRQTEGHAEGGDFRLAMVGFDVSGGPWKLAEGRAKPGPGEIVLDRVLAVKRGLSLNEEIHLLGRTFRIVGISEETNLFILQYAFIDRAEAEGLLLPPGMASFFVVRVEEGVSPTAAAEAIEAEIPGVSALTLDEFRDNNTQVVGEAFAPILIVLYGTGFLVGMMVVGQTIYAATLEKMREFAILKAIGARGRTLFSVLLQQSLLSSLLGFLAGVGFTAFLAVLIRELVPAMPLFFQPSQFLGLFLAAVGMSVAASYMPLRRILKVDPATVFRRG